MVQNQEKRLIRPLGKQVLIQPINQDTTPSGILLPETQRKNVYEGIVKAVGEDDEIKVSLNDKVLYVIPVMPPPVEVGKELLLMDYGRILAKID